MKKVFFLFGAAILFLIVLGFILREALSRRNGEELSVLTYQKEYQIGENPKVKIKNNSSQAVCFSSCYPYYLEGSNGELKSYQYGNCKNPDVTETCVEPGEVKAFELLVEKMPLHQGKHRVAIPACMGCTFNQNFREDRFFYSNEFMIK